MDEHSLGQRLSIGGSLCTVRYVGEVQGMKSSWLGVEWDDPARGKHSGQHDGVKYFECKSWHPTAGSFVRPSRAFDVPQSFLGALQRKYGDDSASRALESRVEWGGKVVEEVGFAKVRDHLAKFQELRTVLLDGACIAGLLGADVDSNKEVRDQERKLIEQTCPKLLELDFSRNLLQKWEEVLEICDALPEVRALRVNGNRFSDLAVADAFDASAGRKITELSLDHTLLEWENIAHLVQKWTSLQLLSASFNQICGPLVNDLPRSLTSVALEGNAFRYLSELRSLSKLPKLQKLFLRDNMIEAIQDGQIQTNVQEISFPTSCAYVDLSHNKIQDWSFIDRLQEVFPGLTALRVAHNPLFNTSGADKDLDGEQGFVLTVARLRNLKNLNFSNVSIDERRDAEMYYLSLVAKEISEAPTDREASIQALHPRYFELSDKYGPPTIVRKAPTSVNPNSLEARLITFHFTLDPSLKGSLGEVIVKNQTMKIPRGFDIYRVKGLIGRRFNIRPFSTRLIWESEEWDPVEGYEDESSDEDDVPRQESAKWMRREVELEDSTRDVGFWIEGSEAKVRIEPQ